MASHNELGILGEKLAAEFLLREGYEILEFAADYERYFEGGKLMADVPYIILKIGVLATYIYFMWGFVIMGNLVKQYLLKIASFFVIGITALFYINDILSLFTTPLDIEYVIATHSIFFGIANFLLGLALLRTAKVLGTVASVTGGLTIGAAVMFILIFMSWLGYIFLIPITFLQIIILFKMEGLLVEKQKQLL